MELELFDFNPLGDPFFGWSRSRDPKEAQISLYGGWGPFGSRIRAFERFEG